MFMKAIAMESGLIANLGYNVRRIELRWKIKFGLTLYN
jgi:hypothetical protein